MFDFFRFKQLCKQQGLSGAYIANRLGKARSFFTDLKNGKFQISQSDLEIVASLLHTTPAYLMGEKKEPTGENASGLSDEDRELIEAFRAASPEKRQAILALLK